MAQLHIGALRGAEANLRRMMELCREIEDEWSESIGRQELGRLLAFRGQWEESGLQLGTALDTWEEQSDVQGQTMVWYYRALRALLLARASALEGERAHELSAVHIDSALAAAGRALELAKETSRTIFSVPRDYVGAHWLLGAARRSNGDLGAADRHLSKALTISRRINLVESEADVLLDLARLRAAQGHHDEAVELASEALLITERCGYVLQGADVHLFLARVALEDGDRQKALEHAQKAHQLATCDGPPDYTYQVAYDEAGALLAELGQPVD
jgi:tetratricopeptide (TPR) repeat protein